MNHIVFQYCPAARRIAHETHQGTIPCYVPRVRKDTRPAKHALASASARPPRWSWTSIAPQTDRSPGASKGATERYEGSWREADHFRNGSRVDGALART